MQAPDTTNRKAAAAFSVAILAMLGYFGLFKPWLDSQQPISEAELEIMDQQLLDTSISLQGQLAEDLSVRQLAEEQTRQNSPQGLALALRCEQWTEVNSTRTTDDSQKFMDWACKRYNHFVTRGELLPDEPPD